MLQSSKNISTNTSSQTQSNIYIKDQTLRINGPYVIGPGLN